jgi:hypothetical protein
MDGVAEGPNEVEQPPEPPGFGERGRMRRRARFLRRARELAYRDLGGLVFDLHRFGQRNDPLVLAKLATLRQIDTELRELESVLRDRRPVTVLREVGIAACPRCAAIHGSDDRFCPGCGLAFDANADRPISTAPVIQAGQASPAPTAAVPAPTATARPYASATAASSPAPVSPSTVASPPTGSSPPAPASPPTVASPPTAPSPPPTAQPASPGTPAKGFARAGQTPPTTYAPPLKPTAAPVAAKQGSEERDESAKPDEDEPTQILRPPATGT